MLEALYKDRWWVLLRGILAVLFGILALVFPGLTLTTLVLLFGIYAIIDGAATIYMAFRSRTSNTRWWVLLVEGIIAVIAGIAAFVYPGMTVFVLLYVIAFSAILTGIMEIIAAIQLREQIKGEFWLGLGGVISILAGIALILFPGAGALTVAWLIGIYAILFGVMLILLFFRLNSGGGVGDQTTSQNPA